MSSTMFLSNLTILDHAYIDQRGNVVGGSFNPSFFVSGEVDPVEQVVVDFSAVKKQIKNIIDDCNNGFDHKLWFINGFSNGTINCSSDGCTITTPTTTLKIPQNAVKIIEDVEYTTSSISKHLETYVQTELRKLHPSVDITVECINSTVCHYPTLDIASNLFRYTHGLKDSTSWGCKNIAHGHLSYIQLLPVNAASAHLSERICGDLDDTVFVFVENVSAKSDDSHLVVEYNTPERGSFYAKYLRSAYNIVVLETETTVEHLVDYIACLYNDDLTRHKITRILVSEGLSKGASCTVM